ncbi:MAG: hypothetical protein ACRC6H_09085 [Culicoidibacterales bacterium]
MLKLKSIVQKKKTVVLCVSVALLCVLGISLVATVQPMQTVAFAEENLVELIDADYTIASLTESDTDNTAAMVLVGEITGTQFEELLATLHQLNENSWEKSQLAVHVFTSQVTTEEFNQFYYDNLAYKTVLEQGNDEVTITHYEQAVIEVAEAEKVDHFTTGTISKKDGALLINYEVDLVNTTADHVAKQSSYFIEMFKNANTDKELGAIHLQMMQASEAEFFETHSDFENIVATNRIVEL